MSRSRRWAFELFDDDQLVGLATAPPEAPPDISYLDSPIAADIQDPIATSPTNIGGTATSYAVTGGDALADFGLTLNAATGEVTGTLTASGTMTTEITATGPGGDSTPAELEIVVTNIAPVTSWGSPRTVVLATSPTISPVNTGGDAITSYEEVAGATNVLADANLQINASTGVITAIDGSGATPLGDYAFKVRAVNAIGNGNTYDLVLHVVLAGGDDDGGPIQRTAILTSAIETSAIQTSALG